MGGLWDPKLRQWHFSDADADPALEAAKADFAVRTVNTPAPARSRLQLAPVQPGTDWAPSQPCPAWIPSHHPAPARLALGKMIASIVASNVAKNDHLTGQEHLDWRIKHEVYSRLRAHYYATNHRRLAASRFCTCTVQSVSPTGEVVEALTCDFCISACCSSAERQNCVCDYSVSCQIHGSSCCGSHD
jgi:hypothetical protein